MYQSIIHPKGSHPLILLRNGVKVFIITTSNPGEKVLHCIVATENSKENDTQSVIKDVTGIVSIHQGSNFLMHNFGYKGLNLQQFN